MTTTDPWAQPQRGRIIHPDDGTDQWTPMQLAQYVGFDWQAFLTADVSGILPPPTLPHPGQVVECTPTCTDRLP